MHSYERALLVPVEDLEFSFAGHEPLAWLNFLLNPRRLRGSDFLMRWSQGVWSEHRLTDAVNRHREFYAIPYGPSGTAPDGDPREFELYFERLEKAGLGDIKRPDLLIFRREDEAEVDALVASIGGLEELPFHREVEDQMRALLDMAVIGVECENSLWVAEQMPDYGSEMKPMARLGGKMGLRKDAVIPTIIVKEEDRVPLRTWQNKTQVAIHVWHVFFDLAYGISLDRYEALIEDGTIEPRAQTYQAPGGATTKKTTYRLPYHFAYRLARAAESPRLVARHIVDKNGHVLPFVHFEGGTSTLDEEAVQVLREEAK